MGTSKNPSKTINSVLRKMSQFDNSKLGLLDLDKMKGIGAQFNLVKNENNRLDILGRLI